MTEAEPVRVGDRYLRGDHERITISSIDVDRGMVTYTAMGLDASRWIATTGLPLPDAWVKVGSGPMLPDERCLWCEKYAHEEGQYFCTDCLTALPEQWVGMSSDGIAKQIEAMKLHRDDDHG